MALWGPKWLASLRPYWNQALIALAHAAAHRQILIVSEVVLSVQRLIKKHGPSLRSEWDAVLSLLQQLRFVIGSESGEGDV